MKQNHKPEAFNGAVFVRLLGTLKTSIPTALAASAALLISAGSELGIPVFLQYGIDHGVLANNLSRLWTAGGAVLVLLVTGMVSSFFSVYCLSQLSQDIMVRLRTSLLSRFHRQRAAYLYGQPVGTLVSAVTSDVATLSDFFNTLFTSLLKDFLVMSGAIVTLFFLNASLAFVVVLSLPPVIILVAVFRKLSRKASREVRRRVAKVNAFLSEHLQGIQVVQLFAREESTKKAFGEENSGLLAANLRELMVNAIFRPLVDVFWAITLAFLLWYGTGLSLAASVTLGTLVAFINLVTRFYQPAGSLAENFTQLQSAVAGAERVFGFLERDEAIPNNGTNTIDTNRPLAVRFDRVEFRYLPDEPVLRGLSFDVDAGSTVAIVGYTGAGKTTITSLLSRMWDVDEGQILIDGKDIRSYALFDLRGAVQGVLQDVFLFAGTIAENIDLGKGLPRERLVELCRLVQADPWIQKLPLGYDTVLNEGGTTLSTGQRQLLSFARVLAQDPAILVLDEATAHVDTETEGALQAALHLVLQGRTSLVIAHRLSTIRRADKILVLDKGVVAEQGNHEELMKTNGFYARLNRLHEVMPEEPTS